MSDLTAQERLQEDHELRETMALGFDVEAWVKSPVGRYCVDKAHEEIEGFRSDLEGVDATNAAAVQAIQCEIRARRVWQEWMQGAITEGEQRQRELIEQHSS